MLIESPIFRLTCQALAVVDDVWGARLAVWSDRAWAAVETLAGQMVALRRVGQCSFVTVTRRTLIRVRDGLVVADSTLFTR